MNKKNANFTLFVLFLLFSIFLAILPIKISSNLKREIIQSKEKQVELIKNNLSLIPELINLSKGYLIHNEETLKNIIKINILAKEQPTNINEIYNNQSKLLSITMELVENSKKQSPLLANKDFIKITNALENLIKQFHDEKKVCNAKSKKLLKFAKLPIYKNFIKIDNISEIICSDNLIELKSKFKF